MPYRHIALFRIRPDVPLQHVEDALGALKRLGSETGEPIEWTVARSLDTRKGTVLVENALFSSEASFREWRQTAEHKEVVALMAGISDWTIGDYDEP